MTQAKKKKWHSGDADDSGYMIILGTFSLQHIGHQN